MRHPLKPALPPQVVAAITKEPHLPNFAKDLLKETTDPPPPKSDTRKWIEAIAKDLNVALQREESDTYNHTTIVDRTDESILSEIRKKIASLKEDKKVSDAIETLAKHFFPFSGRMFGPPPWDWRY